MENLDRKYYIFDTSIKIHVDIRGHANLDSLPFRYGFYYDKLHTITKNGKKGTTEIKKQIESLRLNPPKKVADVNISKIDDYKTGLSYFKNGKKEKLDLPKTNLIIYYLEDNSRISIRPSGTEPKIKFYINLYSKFGETFELKKESNKLEKRAKQIIKHFN